MTERPKAVKISPTDWGADPVIEEGDEKAGEPINGSTLYREFCVRCNAKMRVERNRIGHRNYCERCSPKHVGVGRPSSIVNTPDHDPDAFGKSYSCKDQ
jgi:hypothetical protein